MKNTKHWRPALVAGLLCVGLLLLSDGSRVLNASAAGDVEPVIEKLKNAIAESGAEVSISFKDYEAVKTFTIHNIKMHAASLMKVPVMIEVFKQADQGKFSLDDKIKVTN